MINFELETGTSQLLVTAIHNGHEIRPEILPYLTLTDKEREREEDPHTANLTNISDNFLRISTSRFETDVNRPREKAVYRTSEDAWGLQLYNKKLPNEIVESSLQNYDEFYRCLHQTFTSLLEQYDWLIIYDLHSYNHRRDGIDNFADPKKNPEINIGTKNVNHDRWRNVIDCLIHTIENYNYEGRHLDVGENVKFKGGYFTQWLYENFKDKVCPIAIEIKKFFMDEWTGETDMDQLNHLRQLLINTIHPMLDEASKS